MANRVFENDHSTGTEQSANSFIMSLPINVPKYDVTANEVIQNRPGTESHSAIIA